MPETVARTIPSVELGSQVGPNATSASTWAGKMQSQCIIQRVQ